MRSCAMVEATSPTPLSPALPHARRFKFSAARFPPWRPIGHLCHCATSKAHEELSDHIQGSFEAGHALFEPSQAVPECGGSPRRLTKPRLKHGAVGASLGQDEHPQGDDDGQELFVGQVFSSLPLAGPTDQEEGGVGMTSKGPYFTLHPGTPIHHTTSERVFFLGIGRNRPGTIETARILGLEGQVRKRYAPPTAASRVGWVSNCCR